MIRRNLFLSIASLLLLGSCAHQDQDWSSIRRDNLACDLDGIYYEEDEENLGTLKLDDILNISCLRNIDLLVREREITIQEGIAEYERYKMLPSIKFNTEDSGRDTAFGEFSKSLATQATNEPGSRSRDHNTKKWDLSGAWSFLDFGLAYYRSRQEKNRSMISCYEYQKTRQNLVLDIVTEYWKAYTAKQAIDSSVALLEKAEERNIDIDNQMNSKIISEMEGLKYKDRIVGVKIQLQSYKKNYESAKRELSSLMGLPPSIQFEIDSDIDFTGDPNLNDISDLEEMGLLNRPELFTQDIQEKIIADEVRTAVIKMFPNATLFAEKQYDGDFFIINSNWAIAGIRASWALLEFPQHSKHKAALKLREQLARETRLALSIGILAQVHISQLEYFDAMKHLRLAEEQFSIKNKLLKIGAKQASQGLADDGDVFDYEIDNHLFMIHKLKAYSESQVALEKINNSIGMPMRFNTHKIYACESSSEEAQVPPEDKEVKKTKTMGNKKLVDEISSKKLPILKPLDKVTTGKAPSQAPTEELEAEETVPVKNALDTSAAPSQAPSEKLEAEETAPVKNALDTSAAPSNSDMDKKTIRYSFDDDSISTNKRATNAKKTVKSWNDEYE
jgi:outer membrane protein